MKNIYNSTEILLQEAKINRGGDFNLFSVLNIERDEVFTHSNMIYSFLNSESGHLMGDKYLKLFLEIVLGINKTNGKMSRGFLRKIF